MDPIQKRELKRKAWMRLAAQRRRAGLLRGRVVVISLICFVVLWGVVFAQMATGNDPVLGGKETAATRQTAANRHRGVGAVETQPEEAEAVETEPEEAEAVEAEPEELEAEFAEAEPELEPLVTSQS